MGYVDKNLISDEAVTCRARLHWILFVKPALIGLAVAAVAGSIFYSANLATKIESVGVEQSITGRTLGFRNHRHPRNRRVPWNLFHRVSSPLRFRNEIQEQVGRSSQPVNRSL